MIEFIVSREDVYTRVLQEQFDPTTVEVDGPRSSREQEARVSVTWSSAKERCRVVVCGRNGTGGGIDLEIGDARRLIQFLNEFIGYHSAIAEESA